MCLTAATSRRPLFTTAYKIIEKSYGRYTGPYTIDRINVESSEWIFDRHGYSIQYPYNMFFQRVFWYKTGFHAYVNLTDAISQLKNLQNRYPNNEFLLFEIDTDDIVEYGVEWQTDVVVSRAIKFIQRII